MSNQFSVGEIVDCVFGINAGFQVEILEIGPFAHIGGGSSDYFCTAPAIAGKQYFDASSLRKRPDDKPFTSWFEKTILLDLDCRPTYETIKRTLTNISDYTGARR